MRIAINGAGIAGPTLAWWLARAGNQVTLIEQAPSLRSGGYVIDFWGVGYDIAEKMGLVPQILERGYQVQQVRFVDQHGHRAGGFGVDVFSRATNGRFTSIRRSDLAAIIFAALGDHVETIFGDSVSAIDEDAGSVHLEFDRSSTRDFDLVVGADGLHSRVRQLTFGPESDFEVPLGYHVAAFEVTGYRPRDELVYVTYGVPGRQISRFAMRDDRTLFLCVFRDEYLSGAAPAILDHKAELQRIFSGLGWECDRILEAMKDVSEIYFDSVSQIRMNAWTRGRVALAGDAAACVSLLAGEGTGLAMAESYVLAAELSRCADHSVAFAAYERRMMPFIAGKQRSAAKFASSFAPKTSIGLRFRNFVSGFLDIPLVAEWFITRDLRDDISLPAEPTPASVHSRES